MKVLSFAGDDRLRTAAVEGAAFLAHLQLWRPTTEDQLTTGHVETAAVLLSGTFDLVGGPTPWPARGARKTPFQGRPMAVFLPPRTVFRAERGQGEILLVGARQPAAEAAPQGRQALGHKPLLPLAGSGKAFDPNSGEWRPAETFPTAPESLPPRRMERLAVGALTVERVLAADYKAATLSIDEVVLPTGQHLGLGEIPGRPPCTEALLFVRSEGHATCRAGDAVHDVRGDAVFVFDRGEIDAATVHAETGSTYALVAWAGKA
jgi:5-deoxy-D-glucuronate isomerase